MKEVKSLIFGVGAVVMAMVLGASLLANTCLAALLKDQDKRLSAYRHDD